jgi:hypothetical protein
MITRFAFFEGKVVGDITEFRRRVAEEMVQTWTAFPGAIAVRVLYPESWDADAPEYALILETDYPDEAALQCALDSQERLDSRAATQKWLLPMFDGKIHHHITYAHKFTV